METLNFSAFNIGILVLTLICMIAIGNATRKMKLSISDGDYIKKIYGFYGVFLLTVILLSGLSVSGFFYNFTTMPPRSSVLLVVFFAFISFLSTRSIDRGLKGLLVIPANWLVAFQIYRLGAEVILAGLHREHMVPIELTWHGRNFDIIVALAALPVAFMLWKKTKYAAYVGVAFNIFSLLSLANILFVAFFSLPSPFQKYATNLLTSYFPGILIPAFLAPLALYISILSLKQCLQLANRAKSQMQLESKGI